MRRWQDLYSVLDRCRLYLKWCHGRRFYRTPKTEPVPDELEVVQVTTTNLKQLCRVQSASQGRETEATIFVNEDAQAVIDEDSNFEISEDKKTVIITLTEAAARQEVIDLASGI